MSKYKEGDIVFMKASSGLCGYGNAQCISSVCEPLGEVSLYGHNQLYKTYDIDRVVERDLKRAAAPDMYEALKDIVDLHANYIETDCETNLKVRKEMAARASRALAEGKSK